MRKQIHLDSLFRIFLLLVFCTKSFGQVEKDTVKNPRPAYYYDLLGSGKIGMLLPNPYGDNSLSEAYDTGNGIQLEAKVHVNNRFGVGLQYQVFKGQVTNQVLVGGIDASRITHFFALVSINHLKLKSNWRLETDFGIGYLEFLNERGPTIEFKDTGVALKVSASLSYRFANWIGAYVQVQNNWGFLSIDTAEIPEIREALRRTALFAPSFGLRFYVL